MDYKAKAKYPFVSWFANFLILGSIAGFVYIYYPVINSYIPFPAKETSAYAKTGFFIDIPKIHASAPIIENVDPWKKDEYSKALQKGVASAEGFASPGEKGTVFLFAHSSNDPWTLTRENTPFLRLGELDTGDDIKIFKNGQEFNYKVTNKKELWPSQVEELARDGKDQLILQTCTPVGTSLKRLLVFAKAV